jgi:hypothetical protein
VVEYRVMLEDSRTNKKLDPDGSPLTDTKDLWSRLPKFDSKADAKAYCDEMVERHPHVICSINTPTGPGGTAQEILRVRNRRVFEEQLRAHRERVRQEEKAKPKEGSAGRKPSCPRCGQGRLRMTLRDGDRQGYCDMCHSWSAPLENRFLSVIWGSSAMIECHSCGQMGTARRIVNARFGGRCSVRCPRCNTTLYRVHSRGPVRTPGPLRLFPGLSGGCSGG